MVWRPRNRAATAALIVIGATLLSGCATAPTTQELASADYGEPPRNYEVVIHQYFDSTLKDPASVQYKEITVPQRDWIRDAPVEGFKMHFGWMVRATINAKNSYGGYTGFQTYIFLFRGEQLIETVTPQTIVR